MERSMSSTNLGLDLLDLCFDPGKVFLLVLFLCSDAFQLLPPSRNLSDTSLLSKLELRMELVLCNLGRFLLCMELGSAVLDGLGAGCPRLLNRLLALVAECLEGTQVFLHLHGNRAPSATPFREATAIPTTTLLP